MTDTNTSVSELSQLQYWFLTAMTAAGGLEQGTELAQQRYHYALGEIVTSEFGAPALRRMQVYADGYVQRLQECLQTDYPVLRKVMGDALFDFFARAYIWQQPSTSPSLYDLGAGFAEFLQHSQRAASPDKAQMLLLPVELARLERAYTEALRAPGLEHLPATIDTGSPLLATNLIAAAAPCLRLLQLAMPLLSYWQSISRQEEIPDTPEAVISYVAVTRQHYRVQMLALDAWQYHFLQALQKAETIQPSSPDAAHDALIEAAALCDVDAEQLMPQFMLWLPLAQHVGLLYQSG
jgi:hypothetical protein